MTLPMAAWRVTYTPGNWLVLSGPTMLVVMLPAPARMSGLVSSLWADIANARSVDGLLELLNSYGLDSMPDFGAFFWDANGLHGVARGRIKVTDTDTGAIAVDGEQTVTWREENLGADRHLRIDMEPVDQDAVLQLPLVVGAVTASAIYLTTHADEQIRFPSNEQLGVVPRIPVLGVRPRPRRSAPEVEADEPAAPAQPAAAAVGVPVTAQEAEPEPTPEPEPSPEPEAGTVAEPETENTLEQEPAAADETAPAPEASPLPEVPQSPTAQPSADADAIGTGELAFDTQVMEAPAEPEAPLSAGAAPVAPAPTGIPSAQPPVAPTPAVPTPAAPTGGPVVVPGGFAQQSASDDDGGTIFSTGLAATHKPAAPADSDPDPQVLAVPCANGHANAPGARHCRLCKAPVDSSNARLIRRPALAGVHSNKGEFADIVAGVLVGRSPDASKAPAGSYLMRVPSPSSDISRNHVLVSTRDWSIVVTDLHSTNGTTVMPVGEQPFVLANGDTVQVELGTILDLGDGVSLRIEPPRG